MEVAASILVAVVTDVARTMLVETETTTLVEVLVLVKVSVRVVKAT